MSRWKLEAGSGKLEAGSWKLEAGSWKLEAAKDGPQLWRRQGNLFPRTAPPDRLPLWKQDVTKVLRVNLRALEAGMRAACNKGMMRTRHYRDLQVWQRSMALAREIYAATDCFPRSEQFGLVSQIRRAAVSVPSNIAEGRGRGTEKSFALFLSQARGSIYELQTQIELAGDLGFMGMQKAQSIMGEAAEIASMIQGLVVPLQK